MKSVRRLQLGKNGLTNEFIAQVRAVFEHAEVIKISILKSACRNKDDAKAMAEKLIDTLGKRFVYRLVGYVLTINKFKRDVRA